jgi:cell division protein FtsI/penicillin-binding protein 2
MITASAALQEGVVKPTDLIDTNPGYISFPGRKPIHDDEYNGVLTFEDVIVKSSNIGAIKVGLRVGADRFTKYIQRFGFGQALAPDFPGESAGIFRPQDLNESGLASVSMGYQISVTPLQMVTAASSIANGGLLMEPHIVRAVIRNGQREPIAPKVLRRTITPDVAATLTGMLEGVVQRGTAKAAGLAGYQVAGKTGTAHKVVDHRYSATDFNASFVGFVPSRAPAVALLVLIDSPHGGSYYGGSVSAPIFKKIAEAALAHLSVLPTLNATPLAVINDDGRALTAAWTPVRTSLPTLAFAGGPAAMPDVRGLDAREAVHVLSGAGLSVRVDGAGVVSDQSPDPGTPIAPGTWSAVHLVQRASAQ